jgi:hypothetical protein
MAADYHANGLKRMQIRLGCARRPRQPETASDQRPILGMSLPCPRIETDPLASSAFDTTASSL